MFKKNINRKGGLKNEIKGNPAPCHPDKVMWARGMCKNCYSKWLRKHNPEYSKRQDENVRKWIKQNREQNKLNQEKWRAKQDPEYIKKYKRMKILSSYGMTIEDYDKMLEKQGGVCAVCKNPPKNGKSLHVDHDHTTGLVRGLLCFRCNFGLSYYKEDKQIIENLYKYITKPTTEL